MPVLAAQQLPKLPQHVREALSRVPELAERLLDLNIPQLSLAVVAELESYTRETCDYIFSGPPATSLAVLEVTAKRPILAVGLARLVACACRMVISGSPVARERHLHEMAGKAVLAIGALVMAPFDHGVAAPAASRAAQDVTADLARSILKGQNLHAAAKQAATAAAVLASPEQQAGLSADSLGRFRLRAGQMAHWATFLITCLSSVVQQQRNRALAKAFVKALRESRVLEHTGRLLLLLPPGPSGQPAPQGLAAEQAQAHLHLSSVVRGLLLVGNLAGSSPSLELQPLLGVCGLHALLAFGTSTLASADGGPCGLARDPLLQTSVERDGSFPCVTGDAVQALLLALPTDQESAAPSLSARAALRLLVRVLQLAGASARAASGFVERTAGGQLRVDLSWSGGRRQSSHEFSLLLPPDEVGMTATRAVNELLAAASKSPWAWAAEAGALLPALFAGARHCLGREWLPEEADPRVKGLLPNSVAMLFCGLAGDLIGDAACSIAESPDELPPCMLAALEGGVVPLLEALFRAAGDDPAGLEGQMMAQCLCTATAVCGLLALLVHSPPRQAAAFLATYAKLLQRTPPGALLEPCHLGDGPLPPPAWLILAVPLLHFIINVISVGTGMQLPGPVDPCAPCAPLFVLTLAALQLLPALSRLTREAAQLARAVPKPVGTADALILDWLHALSGALGRAGEGSSGGLPSTGRVAAALCLPFLVEEAGAVPLLGALLDALLRNGELPGVRATPLDRLRSLARCCVGLAAAYPGLVLRGGGSGGSGPGGSSGAGGGRPVAHADNAAAWCPAALRLLASRLRGAEPSLSEEVEALAARLEQPTAEVPPECSGRAAEPAAAERLAALKAEVQAVLPPACSNPACVSLAGDSEAGRRRQQCGRCGQVSYCCRECQVAHLRSGHKEACGGDGGGPKAAG